MGFFNHLTLTFIKNVRLIDGSETWGKWREAPIPIYLNFYIHHVTNPDEVELGGKPIFEEKGPYAYLQKRVKVDIKQEDGLNTVKYKEVKTYFFDGEISKNNSEDDLVNVPNIPFVVNQKKYSGYLLPFANKNTKVSLVLGSRSHSA